MDFAQVESQYKELKRKYDAGAITEDEFKAQLQDLMIQDEEGRWWSIGYETGQWHYHDGEQWVRAEPPRPPPEPPEARRLTVPSWWPWVVAATAILVAGSVISVFIRLRRGSCSAARCRRRRTLPEPPPTCIRSTSRCSRGAVPPAS